MRYGPKRGPNYPFYDWVLVPDPVLSHMHTATENGRTTITMVMPQEYVDVIERQGGFGVLLIPDSGMSLGVAIKHISGDRRCIVFDAIDERLN